MRKQRGLMILLQTVLRIFFGQTRKIYWPMNIKEAKTDELLMELSDDPDKAMMSSKKIAEALEGTNIGLG